MADKPAHEMRDPVYGLLIAPETGMRDAIHHGEKTISIREGWRDYRPGAQILIACHLAPWAVMATVSEVRHTTFRGLTPKELADDGATTAEAFLEDIRRFGARYEKLTLDSPATVIRWTDVRGYWVDNKSVYYGNEVELLRSAK
ncbi:MAG TPA: ASCH domain-containing protein [Candidatus Paceibacterota bacterium]|nr:ASCH domain-containing protein [Candidatus Paceibacterota bacterium]